MGFLKSAFIVSFFTLISRIFGFIRDILIAKHFGSSIFSDVFFTAFKLPNFFRKIFAEGAFNSAFVPIFSSKLAIEDSDNVDTFARNIFSFLLYSLLIIVIVAEIFMPFFIKIIAPGFVADIDKFSLTISLAKITFPYLLFISLVSMMSGILNSYNKFAVVSACPIILNLSFIFALVIFTNYTKVRLTYILSWAVFLAGFLQFVWLFFFTFKQKTLLYPVFPRIDIVTKSFFLKFFHGVLGSGIVQINTMVDSIIATLIPNAVTYLYYANRVSQFPLALIGTALGTGILPILSKNIEQKNMEETANIQEKALFTALFLGIPASVGLFYLANLLITVLFERGAFLSADTTAVSNVLKIYAIGLPVFISNKILQTIFYARKDTKTPMIVSAICLLINVVLNLLFLKPFGYLGIALATIISSFSNLGFLLYFLKSKIELEFSQSLKLQTLKIFYCSVIMFLVIVFINGLFDKFINAVGVFDKTLKLGTLGLGGFLVYFLIGHFIGLVNIKVISSMIFKRIKK